MCVCVKFLTIMCSSDRDLVVLVAVCLEDLSSGRVERERMVMTALLFRSVSEGLRNMTGQWNRDGGQGVGGGSWSPLSSKWWGMG